MSNHRPNYGKGEDMRSGGRIVLGVLSLAMLAGCGSEVRFGDPGDVGDSASEGTINQPTSSKAERPMFDPPRAVAQEAIATFEEPYAFLGTDRVVVVREGEREQEPATVKVFSSDGTLRHGFPSDFSGEQVDDVHTVVLDDRAVVLLAGSRVVVGSGTEQDRLEYVVLAYDAATGERLWKSAVEPLGDLSLGVPGLNIVAADARSVVVTDTDDGAGEGNSLVFAMKDGSERWRDENLIPVVLDGDVVVAYEVTSVSGTIQLRGFAADDGHELWEGPRSDDSSSFPWGSMTLVGDHLMSMVEKVNFSTYETHFLGTADGKTVKTLEGEWICEQDKWNGEHTIVCESSAGLVGFDGGSFDELWRLPDEKAGREAPERLGLYHGLVYVNSSHGPMTLDARTGKDKDTDIGLSAGDISTASWVHAVPGYLMVVESTMAGTEVTLYRAVR